MAVEKEQRSVDHKSAAYHRSGRNLQKITEKIFSFSIGQSKSAIAAALTEKTFWIAVYITGSVLTILTCIDICQGYYDNPTSIRV